MDSDLSEAISTRWTSRLWARSGNELEGEVRHGRERPDYGHQEPFSGHSLTPHADLYACCFSNSFFFCWQNTQGSRGYSWEFLVGVCHPILQILTLQTFVTRRPFCLRRFKKLCSCTASLVLSTSLAVHKQSFLNLLRQNGGRVIKVYFRPKNVIFHSRFQTWSLRNYVIIT